MVWVSEAERTVSDSCIIISWAVGRSRSAADDPFNRHDDICHFEKTVSHASFRQMSLFGLETVPRYRAEGRSRCGHIRVLAPCYHHIVR